MSGHLVRIGALGRIGHFSALDAMVFRRGARVICRSSRGLEMGSVLKPVRSAAPLPERDGAIVRLATVEDELLWSRIEKHRAAAYDDCQRLLRQRSANAALMDVELLFDGQTIFFYFLGNVPAEVESLTAELAETYEARVQLRPFAEALVQGCGPDCGTDEAAGCGESCGSCAISGACGVVAAAHR